MDITQLPIWFTKYKEASLYNRYIHYEQINDLLTELSAKIKVEELGSSENGAPIHLLTLGTGSKKLLFWSQMHGNESTTTKAIFDCINLFLDASNGFGASILRNCTLYIIPILNPDGALAYTRHNYNQVDLNRDAQDKTQKESNILSNLIRLVKPDYAFNLHGQRTIFSAGTSNHPATVSFLSPAGDAERSIMSCRKIAMELIVEMNKVLQLFIPHRVGRYDDGFNINCIGDTLTHLGIPTILFEAGHSPNDYEREKTREYIFYSLLTVVQHISENDIQGVLYKDYFEIPENDKCFYDIIIRDVILNGENVDIAIQYQEELSEKRIKFVPIIAKIANLSSFYGHREIIGNGRVIRNENDTVEVVPDNELLRFSLNDELFSTELRKN